jgi:hypothetical protein
MRRRQLNTWVQVNLRIQEAQRRELEAAAKENQVSFNEEVRRRLTESFQIEALDNRIAAIPKTIKSIVKDAMVEMMGSPRVLLDSEPTPHTKEGSGT